MARKAKIFSDDPGYAIARLQAIQRGIYGDKGLSERIRFELTSDITALVQKLQQVQLELIGKNGSSQSGIDSESTKADSEASS